MKIYLQHTEYLCLAISFEKHFNLFRVCFQHVKERVILKLHKRRMRGMRGIYKNNTHARPDDTPTSDCMPVTEYS